MEAAPMKLIGILRSPYVRRTAVSLHAMGIPFELDPVPVFDKPELVTKYNPLTRVPALVLDDGEALIDSSVILDALDEMAGPSKRLTPENGAARRQVLKLVAVALGAVDKAVWSAYEYRFRPEEKVHTPWVRHNDAQVVAGFTHLDAIAAKLGDSSWMADTEKMTQADITAAVGFTFAKLVRPNLGLPEKAPNMAKFTARCEALPPFAAAALPT
jgi:glutathione S-transferase